MIIARTIKKLIIWYQLFCICFNHGLKCVIEFANKDGENNRARPTGGLFLKKWLQCTNILHLCIIKINRNLLKCHSAIKKTFLNFSNQ